MRTGRAQAIIIRDNKILFGYGNIGKRYAHYFIGGGVEEGETPHEAILRELEEEANVKGRIIFQFKNDFISNHYTFLVDIGNHECVLGYDPEELGREKHELALQKLIWIPLQHKKEFSEIDINYFKLLAEECEEQGYYPSWLGDLKDLLKSRE